MSFEGRYQLWCKNGHYREMDACAYEWVEDHSTCWCGLEWVVKNLIDDTNGEEVGKISPTLIEQKRCEHCGSILEEIYAIPDVDLQSKCNLNPPENNQ